MIMSEIESHLDLDFKSFMNGAALEYVRGLLEQSDARLSDSNYDVFGGKIDAVAEFMTFLLFFYKFYFRVETHGIENLPQDGPGLIVANHAPILPVDGMMIGTAALVELAKPRFIRAIISRNFNQTPFFSALMSRIGQVTGSDDNVRRIFENKNLMLVFPTGSKDGPHTIFHRYELDTFQVGFMEYSLRYKTPIIPTSVIGSEEATMMFAKLNISSFGFKSIPITPIFPWLGLAGLIPFPAKFKIYFHEPVDYFTENQEALDDPVRIRELVEDLRGSLQAKLRELS